MKKILLACAISAVFSGCGGGGAAVSPGQASAPAPAPVASPQSTTAVESKMTPYVGTWVGDCQTNFQETIISTAGSDGTLITSAVFNLFANADCSGAIVGTQTFSENFISTYLETVDATVSLSRSGATPLASFKADRYTETIVAHLLNRTGTMMTNPTSDNALQPSYTFNGAAYVSGDDMYILEFKDGILKFDSHYSRKR
ncbi:MAG TPA: hypothetical protein VFS02_06745 [Telluria sp.]|nr:hypothetical protein [Telluria sp.]